MIGPKITSAVFLEKKNKKHAWSYFEIIRLLLKWKSVVYSDIKSNFSTSVKMSVIMERQTADSKTQAKVIFLANPSVSSCSLIRQHLPLKSQILLSLCTHFKNDTRGQVWREEGGEGEVSPRPPKLIPFTTWDFSFLVPVVFCFAKFFFDEK